MLLVEVAVGNYNFGLLERSPRRAFDSSDSLFVDIKLGGKGQAVTLELRDISLTGAQIFIAKGQRTPRYFLNQNVILDMSRLTDFPRTIDAKIVRLEVINGGYTLGIQFCGLTVAEEKGLQQIIHWVGGN